MAARLRSDFWTLPLLDGNAEPFAGTDRETFVVYCTAYCDPDEVSDAALMGSRIAWRIDGWGFWRFGRSVGRLVFSVSCTFGCDVDRQ